MSLFTKKFSCQRSKMQKWRQILKIINSYTKWNDVFFSSLLENTFLWLFFVKTPMTIGRWTSRLEEDSESELLIFSHRRNLLGESLDFHLGFHPPHLVPPYKLSVNLQTAYSTFTYDLIVSGFARVYCMWEIN